MDIRSLIEAYVSINLSGDVSLLPDIIAPDFRVRTSPPIGPEGVATFVRAFHAGFTEAAISLDDCVCEGDRGSFRFVISGRHTGVFMGCAPTGRRITWPGADFMRARDGKLVELWPVQDSLPLMEGLGAVVRASASGA